jgi:uncharacterized cofD-like protein
VTEMPLAAATEDDEWLLRLAGRRVVTIGGGTGPFALLSRLKGYPCTPTAIVSMADSGGSSRRLMDEFGQLPFGDLRQALVALSRKGVLWREVFGFRFPLGIDGAGSLAPAASVNGAGGGGAGVSGHSLGNLILSALQSINEGDLLHAIQDAQELLDTAGNVLPVTLSRATLCAELADGSVICGETEIDTRGRRQPGPLPPIRRVFLTEPAQACPEAQRAIRRADLIVIGPGDLYTSLLPNLLVGGIATALNDADAEKVYVCNLMTKHGETDGFKASDFVRELHHYLAGRVDRVVLHQGPIPAHMVERYAAEQQRLVEADADAVRRLGPEVVVADLAAGGGDRLVRHRAERLIRAIFSPPPAPLPAARSRLRPAARVRLEASVR